MWCQFRLRPVFVFLCLKFSAPRFDTEETAREHSSPFAGRWVSFASSSKSGNAGSWTFLSFSMFNTKHVPLAYLLESSRYQIIFMSRWKIYFELLRADFEIANDRTTKYFLCWKFREISKFHESRGSWNNVVGCGRWNCNLLSIFLFWLSDIYEIMKIYFIIK